MTESVKNELSDICRIIDATVDTEKIYLFGSYAYGTPTDDSDYDLCVIIPENSMRPADAVKAIRRALFSAQSVPLELFIALTRSIRERNTLLWSGKSQERGSCCMSTGWSSEWLDFAYMDLSAAEHLLTMRPLPVEIICYHCEQAAEKFLKATLVQFDREPPKTHDLIQLCKLCCEVDTRFEQLADSCIELTPYGVQVRYPSNLELDESDAVCALKECRLVQDFVCQKLGYEPESKDTQSFGQTMK